MVSRKNITSSLSFIEMRFFLVQKTLKAKSTKAKNTECQNIESQKASLLSYYEWHQLSFDLTIALSV